MRESKPPDLLMIAWHQAGLCPAGLPGNIHFIFQVIGQTGQDEKHITEPIEINQWLRIKFLVLHQRDQAALGPAAYGAGYVQLRRQHGTTRQHKLSEWSQPCVSQINLLFEKFRVRGRYPSYTVGVRGIRRRGQIRAQVKKLVLNFKQQCSQRRLGAGRNGQSQHAVEFIDCAVRFNAPVVFRYTCAVKKTGSALITLTGINLHDGASRSTFVLEPAEGKIYLSASIRYRRPICTASVPVLRPASSVHPSACSAGKASLRSSRHHGEA